MDSDSSSDDNVFMSPTPKESCNTSCISTPTCTAMDSAPGSSVADKGTYELGSLVLKKGSPDSAVFKSPVGTPLYRNNSFGKTDTSPAIVKQNNLSPAVNKPITDSPLPSKANASPRVILKFSNIGDHGLKRPSVATSFSEQESPNDVTLHNISHTLLHKDIRPSVSTIRKMEFHEGERSPDIVRFVMDKTCKKRPSLDDSYAEDAPRKKVRSLECDPCQANTLQNNQPDVVSRKSHVEKQDEPNNDQSLTEHKVGLLREERGSHTRRKLELTDDSEKPNPGTDENYPPVCTLTLRDLQGMASPCVHGETSGWYGPSNNRWFPPNVSVTATPAPHGNNIMPAESPSKWDSSRNIGMYLDTNRTNPPHPSESHQREYNRISSSGYSSSAYPSFPTSSYPYYFGTPDHNQAYQNPTYHVVDGNTAVDANNNCIAQADHVKSAQQEPDTQFPKQNELHLSSGGYYGRSLTKTVENSPPSVNSPIVVNSHPHTVFYQPAVPSLGNCARVDYGAGDASGCDIPPERLNMNTYPSPFLTNTKPWSPSMTAYNSSRGTEFQSGRPPYRNADYMNPALHKSDSHVSSDGNNLLTYPVRNPFYAVPGRNFPFSMNPLQNMASYTSNPYVRSSYHANPCPINKSFPSGNGFGLPGCTSIPNGTPLQKILLQNQRNSDERRRHPSCDSTDQQSASGPSYAGQMGTSCDAQNINNFNQHLLNQSAMSQPEARREIRGRSNSVSVIYMNQATPTEGQQMAFLFSSGQPPVLAVEEPQVAVPGSASLISQQALSEPCASTSADGMRHDYIRNHYTAQNQADKDQSNFPEPGNNYRTQLWKESEEKPQEQQTEYSTLYYPELDQHCELDLNPGTGCEVQYSVQSSDEVGARAAEADKPDSNVSTNLSVELTSNADRKESGYQSCGSPSATVRVYTNSNDSEDTRTESASQKSGSTSTIYEDPSPCDDNVFKPISPAMSPLPSNLTVPVIPKVHVHQAASLTIPEVTSQEEKPQPDINSNPSPPVYKPDSGLESRVLPSVPTVAAPEPSSLDALYNPPQVFSYITPHSSSTMTCNNPLQAALPSGSTPLYPMPHGTQTAPPPTRPCVGIAPFYPILPVPAQGLLAPLLPQPAQSLLACRPPFNMGTFLSGGQYPLFQGQALQVKTALDQPKNNPGSARRPRRKSGSGSKGSMSSNTGSEQCISFNKDSMQVTSTTPGFQAETPVPKSRFFSLLGLHVGTFSMNEPDTKKRLSRIQFQFSIGKITYEIPYFNPDASPAKSSIHIALVDVPFHIIVGLNADKNELLFELMSSPRIRTKDRFGRGVKVPARSSVPGIQYDPTDGQLSTCPYHKLILRPDVPKRILELMAATNSRFGNLGTTLLEMDPNKQISPSEQQSNEETQGPKHKPVDKVVSSTKTWTCSCITGCLFSRCKCATALRHCGPKCKCTQVLRNCVNPINQLTRYGIPLEAAKQDHCLMANIFRIKALVVYLGKEVKFPCCSVVSTVSQCIPGEVRCPREDCPRRYSYSWCNMTLMDTSSEPRRHCKVCCRCSEATAVHCYSCNTCFVPSEEVPECPCQIKRLLDCKRNRIQQQVRDQILDKVNSNTKHQGVQGAEHGQDAMKTGVSEAEVADQAMDTDEAKTSDEYKEYSELNAVRLEDFDNSETESETELQQSEHDAMCLSYAEFTAESSKNYAFDKQTHRVLQDDSRMQDANAKTPNEPSDLTSCQFNSSEKNDQLKTPCCRSKDITRLEKSFSTSLNFFSTFSPPSFVSSSPETADVPTMVVQETNMDTASRVHLVQNQGTQATISGSALCHRLKQEYDPASLDNICCPDSLVDAQLHTDCFSVSSHNLLPSSSCQILATKSTDRTLGSPPDVSYADRGREAEELLYPKTQATSNVIHDIQAPWPPTPNDRSCCILGEPLKASSPCKPH